MRNLFSDRLAWFGVVVIAAALIVPAGASAEVATIQCKQSYDLDDNHNVVVVYENFQVSDPEDPEEEVRHARVGGESVPRGLEVGDKATMHYVMGMVTTITKD